MANIITVLVLVALVSGAGTYIYKKKKAGAKCIGCSCCSESCSGKCSSEK